MKKKIFLSFIDQGIVSLSNFLLIIILARIFDKADFGFISFLLFIGVLINNIQISLITQPHNVIAANLGKNSYEKYTNGALGLQILLLIILIVMSILIYTLQYLGLINLHDDIAFIMFSIFYLTLKQVQDFFRRILFTSGNINQIVIGDFVAYGGGILLLLLVLYFKIETLYQIIMFITIPFILSILYLLVTNRIEYKFSKKDMLFTSKKSFNFARWSFLSALASWLGTRVFPITLGLLVSMEAVAVYAVLMNIINTLNPIFYTLTNFLTTVFARVSDKSNLLKQTINVFFALLPIILLSIIVLIFYPKEILSLLYGSVYIEYVELLQYISSSIFLIAIANILQLYLRSSQSVKYIFKSFLYSSVFSLTIGSYLIYTYQIHGAVLAFILSWIVSDILLGFYVFKSYRAKI